MKLSSKISLALCTIANAIAVLFVSAYVSTSASNEKEKSKLIRPTHARSDRTRSKGVSARAHDHLFGFCINKKICVYLSARLYFATFLLLSCPHDVPWTCYLFFSAAINFIEAWNGAKKSTKPTTNQRPWRPTNEKKYLSKEQAKKSLLGRRNEKSFSSCFIMRNEKIPSQINEFYQKEKKKEMKTREIHLIIK